MDKMINPKKLQKSYSEHLAIKNYANNTQQSYNNSINQYLNFIETQGLNNIGIESAKQFIVFKHSQKYSWSQVNQHYSAIKILFEELMDLEWDYKLIPRPRGVKSLPKLISKKEVEKIINHATCFKHQIVITLLYAAGLRISELSNLELTDIHGDRCQLHIRKGKGGKDRFVQIPESILELLRDYYLRYKPIKYLLNGQVKGEPLSTGAIGVAIKNARHRANVIKPVSAHTFRHCYATHHLEEGSSIVYLQKQMGHNNLKTTAQYIQLAQSYRQTVVHPIDVLKISYFKRNRPSVNYLETLENSTSGSIRPRLTK